MYLEFIHFTEILLIYPFSYFYGDLDYLVFSVAINTVAHISLSHAHEFAASTARGVHCTHIFSFTWALQHTSHCSHTHAHCSPAIPPALHSLALSSVSAEKPLPSPLPPEEVPTQDPAQPVTSLPPPPRAFPRLLKHASASPPVRALSTEDSKAPRSSSCI